MMMKSTVKTGITIFLMNQIYHIKWIKLRRRNPHQRQMKLKVHKKKKMIFTSAMSVRKYLLPTKNTKNTRRNVPKFQRNMSAANVPRDLHLEVIWYNTMIITIPTSLNSSVVNLVIQTLSLKNLLKNITDDFTTQETTNICVISAAGNFGIDKNLPYTEHIIQETNHFIVEFANLLHLLIPID